MAFSYGRPAAGPAHGSANGHASSSTVTSLSRWSILSKQLPTSDKIKAIHVYDFDNTLFKTPLPNPQIWNGTAIGILCRQDAFANGGWWHDSRILAATGQGLAREEERAWEGWWNEKMVELVKLSTRQSDALCVLLTGRSESGFSDLIRRMITSKGLDFDMVALKPAVGPNNQRFPSTMIFKQKFLEALMETYAQAEEMRIYEDRPKHVAEFRNFMVDYNRRQNGVGGVPTRGPIAAEVVQVVDVAANLDPVVEVAEVQHIVNAHNAAVAKGRGGFRGERLAIGKTVLYTGYMISSADTERLLRLAQLPTNVAEYDGIKYHANNIMICPRACPPDLLEKVGGMGSKMLWEVTGLASLENDIWAASVQPVPATAHVHTENARPLVVLALRKGTRAADASHIQNWQPVAPDQAFVFETTVGEKVLLRIDPVVPGERGYEGAFAARAAKRKYGGAEDNAYHHQHGTPSRPAGQYGQGNKPFQRNFHHQANHNMARRGSNQGGVGGGGRGGFRGNGTPNRGYRVGSRGGGGAGTKGGRGGRAAGAGHGYRSLDDVQTRGGGHHGGTPTGVAFRQQVVYDDEPQSRAQSSRDYPAPAQNGPVYQAQQPQQQGPNQQQTAYGAWQAPSRPTGNGPGEPPQQSFH